jgi:arginine N-succinyltransferase
MTIRYEIRAAISDDEEQLLKLAGHLNTVNLPNERGHVRRLLETSEKSFRGQLDPRRRKYVFVLWDLERDAAAGTSMLIAQLGRRDAPYIYFDVTDEEKDSSALDKHFHHTVLRLGFSYKGPTEIGGLIVAPEYRKAPEKLGLLISYVRFWYLAIHRDLFQKEVLAELLPPLEPDGSSRLWDAVGRRFTDMSYAEADLLSSENKDFVRDLFPRELIYATLLSSEAQAVIGKVGAQTRGVEKMLRRIGFRYAERIDPFDGGPHFIAPVEDITLIQATTRARYTGDLTPNGAGSAALVGREFDGPPYLRVIATNVKLEGHTARLGPGAAAHLGIEPGAEIVVLPLP